MSSSALPCSRARYPTPWISSRFSNPLVTPSTMLAIRLRVSPCSARCSPRLVGRSTVSVPFDWSIFIAGLTAWLSSPLGPLTVTRPGASETVTPSGISIGFFPIRLIAILAVARRSPDVGDDLAADTLLARLVAAHHAAGSRDDRRPHAAEYARHLGAADIAAPARPRDALQSTDHRLALLGVLEPDPDQLTDGGRLDREI